MEPRLSSIVKTIAIDSPPSFPFKKNIILLQELLLNLAKMLPYKHYAVIFTADLSGNDYENYQESANKLVELAKQQKGFLKISSLEKDLSEITISYWKSLEDIKNWKNHPEHLKAQKKGSDLWYKSYRVEVTEILRYYGDKINRK